MKKAVIIFAIFALVYFFYIGYQKGKTQIKNAVTPAQNSGPRESTGSTTSQTTLPTGAPTVPARTSDAVSITEILPIIRPGKR